MISKDYPNVFHMLIFKHYIVKSLFVFRYAIIYGYTIHLSKIDVSYCNNILNFASVKVEDKLLLSEISLYLIYLDQTRDPQRTQQSTIESSPFKEWETQIKMCKYSFITYIVSKLRVFLVNEEERSLLDLCLLYCELCLLPQLPNPTFDAIIEPRIAKAHQILHRFQPPNISARFTDHAFVMINRSGKMICKWYYGRLLVVTEIHPAHTCACDLRDTPQLLGAKLG
jgi:hypothetical protein